MQKTFQLLLTRIIGFFAEKRLGFVTQIWIKLFAKHYQVELSEAVHEKPSDYATFNAFFTRELKPGARPIAESELISPVDGFIGAIGGIEKDQIFQAKGHNYSLIELLGGDAAEALPFNNGLFATLYLSPKNYHRMHMPVRGQLFKTIYVPGQLFPVKQSAVETVPNLFARNERLVCLFETDLGPMAYIMVGALIVAGIETVWQGKVTPPHGHLIMDWDHSQQQIVFDKGDELGRFNLGSTVIMCFEHEALKWAADLQEGQAIQLGQAFSTAAS